MQPIEDQVISLLVDKKEIEVSKSIVDLASSEQIKTLEKPIQKLDTTFPNLVLRTGGALHSEATGVPANGNNTIALGINPDDVSADWLEIEVVPLGPSITAASFVSLSEDKLNITINFTQTGSDQAKVTAKIIHSIER